MLMSRHAHTHRDNLSCMTYSPCDPSFPLNNNHGGKRFTSGFTLVGSRWWDSEVQCLIENHPFVKAQAFLVHWRRRGCTRSLYHLHTPECLVFFMNEETPACKNKFTSECRQQMRFNYLQVQKHQHILNLLNTCFYPEKSLVRTVPLCLSRRSHHLSTF